MTTAIVAGYHNIGCAGLEALIRAGIEVKAVFTYADDPKEAIWFRSVAEIAAEHGIPTHAPDDINHPLWVEMIRDLAPDYLFSFFYRDIIRRPILSIPRRASLNLHGSLLPRYRGRAPINWAIINGERETGVTLHHMTDRPDEGDIVCQASLPIKYDDTASSLNLELATLARSMLDQHLPSIIAGTAPRASQNPIAATRFGRRRPEDGAIDWQQPAETVRNLIRAVTLPYPGAFSWRGNTRILIWKAATVPSGIGHAVPGTILSIDPLTVMCGKGALRIDAGQTEGGVYANGIQLANELQLCEGARLGAAPQRRNAARRRKRVLVLGINGFIGYALTERLLNEGNYEVHGMDLHSDAVSRFVSHPDFHFHEGDIAIQRDWIEYHVKKCDVIVPLVAIATPIEYTRNPLRVFELDFEENLRIVRYCVKYGKRIVFPSTSEVYGMCKEDTFDEDRSRLVLGPISKQRWIYSCSKQLLDRVIWAYGCSEDLRFTLFRPFNWLGPRLDSLESARIGSSRAITQLILNLIEGTPIQMVDGGEQRRCFTDVSDGIECLYRIIEDRDGLCDGKIINIGNPDNEASILELACMLHKEFEKHPLRGRFPPFAGMQAIESSRYYGNGYEDVQHRRPSIDNAAKYTGWAPRVPLLESVRTTLDYFLRDYISKAGDECRPTIANRPLTAVNQT